GDKVRLEIVSPPVEADQAYVDKLWDAFIGSSHSDDPDLASRAKQIVRDEMGPGSWWPQVHPSPLPFPPIATTQRVWRCTACVAVSSLRLIQGHDPLPSWRTFPLVRAGSTHHR